MSYGEALAYLRSLTDFEHVPSIGDAPRFELGRVAELLARLGRPDRSFRSIHVVGTKGKGSTAAMIATILRAAGYRVGLYTSPHLHTFRERIQIDGRLITEDELVAAVAEVRPAIEHVHVACPSLGALTTFEAATAVAMLSFARWGADFAVLEAGLGGRLDATNVIRPEVTVLTPIGLDHTAYLGDTVSDIAREKAAVIKPGVPVVSARQRPPAEAVIVETAKETGAPLAMIGRDWSWEEEGGAVVVAGTDWQGTAHRFPGVVVPLLGRHQRENAALAVAAAGALRSCGVAISDSAVTRGFADVRWPGRLEIMADRPLLVVDGAHNPDAMCRLREALADVFAARRIILVLGCSIDKDLEGIAAEIVPSADVVVVTASRHPRAAPATVLLDVVGRHCVDCQVAPNVGAGIERAREVAGGEDLICVTGSLFVVAEAREALLGSAVEKDPS